MDLSRYGELFLAESREHISAVNRQLLALEAEPGSSAPIEALFRTVHTVKGMAAAMGYRAISDLAHELEELLERVRRGVRGVDAALIDLLFAAADQLEHAIEQVVTDPDAAYDAGDVLERLRAASGVAKGAATRASPAAAEPQGAPGDGVWVEVVVSPHAALPGVRAFIALKRARELGEVKEVSPPEERFQEEVFAGRFGFRLQSERPAAELRDQLLAVGELESVSLGNGGVAPSTAPAPPPPPVAASLTTSNRAGARGRQVRVDPARLDLLMNQAGELVILRDRLRQLVAGSGSEELSEVVDQASRLIEELQGEIMRVRMVPVEQVFERFPRLVRDAAQMLGKRVDFRVEGEELEFDRSMLDAMSEPIVHLLRNALDHGIESPEERRTAGKPEVATLRLVAARERSRAVLRVSDDGRGISRVRVLAKAVASKLVDESAAALLSDDEVYRLILQPGFSTAEQVSDVSGRGVGLDVVATRVRSVGGTLEIASRPREGTVFTLRLPLTLALVHALLVRVGEERYALPVAHVLETAELPADAVEVAGGRRVMLLRDEVVPLLSLRELLRYPPQPEPTDTVAVVVLELGEEELVGLEVDALIAQQEIVVKSFDATSDTLRLFSGATILADGRAALILDAGSITGRE